MGSLALDPSVYKGRRVLVTGDSGFKGSWLSLWLSEMGAEAVGISLPPKTPRDHFTVTELSKRIRHHEIDIRDGRAVASVFEKFQPEIVFHLAAQALVRASYEDPKTTFDTNVGGSVNILEAVRQSPSVRVLVFITSDKCYFNKEWVWGYRENDELGGVDPYSASKAAAENVFQAYLKSYFAKRSDFGAASTRAGNVIGGGDYSPDRIVPDCIRALEKNETIVLRNPQATRPWQHVLEPVGAYLLLASRLIKDPKKFSGSWNFGPDSKSVRTVEDLARLAIEVWGSGSLEVRRDLQAPHEAGLLQLNCDKAAHQLGWKARWDFERTVRETIGWYKNLRSGANACETSLSQIRHYMTGEIND